MHVFSNTKTLGIRKSSNMFIFDVIRANEFNFGMNLPAQFLQTY